MIGVGTLGSSPSLVALNKILIEKKNVIITNKVTTRYFKAKYQIAKLKIHVPQDTRFYYQVLELIRVHHFKEVERLKNSLPEDVYNHFRSCIVGLFRSVRKLHSSPENNNNEYDLVK